ncbi:hypothetical protein [Neomoorella glycerini]|nr:hypothetical protein [Moorella glycerini]
MIIVLSGEQGERVTAPLISLDASGALGKALVSNVRGSIMPALM